MARKKPKTPLPIPANGEMVLYQTDDGRTRIECRFADNTIWLSQTLMAELFQTTVPNVSLHLTNIYKEGEVAVEATVKEFLIVQPEGGRTVSRSVRHYNLPAILAVGYRVQSARGTQFRQWATSLLEEYLRKGFVLDDARLKNPPGPGVPDYFDEMLERIRDIRASEKRVYLRVREILALAADYEPKDGETHLFFQTVQNKLHFAATGKTAPELIAERADHSRSNMGLTSWKGGIVRRYDITVAKNYLNESEIAGLNRIVSMFLDFAEDQAKRRRQVFMRDWRERLDSFLQFNNREVLQGLGRITREEAEEHAARQYSLFEERRRLRAESKAMKALEVEADKILKKPEKR